MSKTAQRWSNSSEARETGRRATRPPPGKIPRQLFIIAEKEELFDNKDQAILAHERATGVKTLVTIKGIKPDGIYNEARDQAQKEAIAWFDEHLKHALEKGSK